MKTKVFVLLGTLAVFVVLGTLGVPGASAQAVYGSIFGTITDPSGAAVARRQGDGDRRPKARRRNHHQYRRQL